MTRKRLAVVLAGLLAPSIAVACVAIGANGPIKVRGEDALIVWDPATKTEHFVRRASFADAPADFAFLVPTPSKPELGEVPVAVFDRLYERYKAPEPRLRSAPSNGPIAAAAMAPPRVDVVEHKVVAGLDATVLRANDGKALAEWLAAHKYPSGPAIEAWLTPYVKRGAYVTAFKLAGGAGAGASPNPQTAVRMTFTTDAPMFPYSEPSKGSPRPFRLSVIAPSKMAGTVEGKAWTATVGFAGPLGEDDAREILDGVTPRASQKSSYLTVFDEPSSVRGAADLVLVPAKEQTRVASTIHTKIVF